LLLLLLLLLLMLAQSVCHVPEIDAAAAASQRRMTMLLLLLLWVELVTQDGDASAGRAGDAARSTASVQGWCMMGVGMRVRRSCRR